LSPSSRASSSADCLGYPRKICLRFLFETAMPK
jgi:hypothetical protein